MLRRALYETDGPVAVRYPRGGEGAYYTGCAQRRARGLSARGDGLSRF